MSSKIFLQFGEEMQIRQHQVGAIKWVIQDGKTKESNSCSCCRIYVGRALSCWKKRLLHVRTNTSKSCFQLSHCSTILLKVNGCSRRHEFLRNTPLTSQKTSSADVLPWNLFGAGHPWWRTAFTVSCSQVRRWKLTEGARRLLSEA